MGWLGKLKLLGGGEDGNKAASPAAPAPAPAVAATLAPVPQAAIDAAYYRWLAGGLPPYASIERERRVLDELARLAAAPIAGAALVPRLPEIIPQLMRILRDEDMNVAELSRQLSRDVVLVAEVYREANRPAYLPRYHAGPPVNSLDSAIMLLGQNGMRMLLARVAFRPVIGMQNGHHTKRVAPLVWRQSEKCALAASLLAPALRANAFEAYLAGLMENVGLVVAFRLIDQVCPEDQLPQSDAFVAALFAQARELSARIAELWEFPAPVAQAVEAAGRDDAPPPARALALGDRLAKLRMLVDAAEYAPDDPFVVDGLDKATLACFERLRDEDEDHI